MMNNKDNYVRALIIASLWFLALSSCTSTDLRSAAPKASMESYLDDYFEGPNPGMEPKVDFPDSYVVGNVCEGIKNVSESSQGDEDEEQRANIVLRVRQLCSAVLSEQIGLDDWWRGFWEVVDDALACRACLIDTFTPPELLPSNYPVYVMFLAPTLDLDDRELLEVWRAYKNFGESIGQRNLAIWFTTDGFAVDIGRSKYYCDRLRLNYNDGPYVVVSKIRPDKLDDTSTITLIRLESVAPERIVSILNILEQDLRRGVHPRESLIIYEEIKQRLLSLGERNGELIKDIVVAALN
jgi:hypothetical protein